MDNTDAPLKILKEALDRRMMSLISVQEEKKEHEKRRLAADKTIENLTEEIDQLIEAILALGGTGEVTPRKTT